MTTYYVRPAADGGSDGAAGTAVGTAWATIDKALSTMVAGDECWVKPGVYRESVTCDNSGSSGSTITVNGDFDGAKFGVVGPVIISAWDSDTGAPVRASCLDMNGKTFVVWNKIQFHGGTSFAVGNTAFGSATAYEGCEFNDCLFLSSGNDFALRLEINAGVTPTANGLTIRRSVFFGKSDVDWDSNGSANVNLKWTVERCLFTGATGTSPAFDMGRVTNGGANTIGGVGINHSLFLSCPIGVSVTNLVNTTNPLQINNCRFVHCNQALQSASSTAGLILLRGNVYHGCTTTFSSATDFTSYPDGERTDQPLMLGGLHDWLYYQTYGWSPFKPWEPMAISGIVSDPCLDYGSVDVTASNDPYGNPAMGRPSVYSHLYYFDGSDASVSDPNNVFTTETNVTDTSLTTAGTTTTTGSTASNYVMAEGTNAPGSGPTIINVYARVRYNFLVSNAANAGEAKLYTDTLGELLGTLTMGNNTSATWTTANWFGGTPLTTPSGGWTWAKIQALEFKAYRSGGTTVLSLYQIQICVDTAEVAPDAGLVEARVLMVQDTSVFDEGAASGRFDGGSYDDQLIPVDAASTTISVRARYDSNYDATGTLPQLLIYNIPGVANQTATMTAGANTWETLTKTFTPTSPGYVRVRLVSNDRSLTGKCYFDNVQAV